MKNIKNFLIGIAMGISFVIPGVSGGTIAVIFNVYDKLMECITINLKVIFKNIYFIIFLGAGIVVGVKGLSSLMEILFKNFPQQTYFGFIGIIIGSLPFIISKSKHGSKLKSSSYIFFIITLVIMIVLTFVNADKTSGSVLFTNLSLLSFLAIFFSMAIATATMIIPGISGSMILIILGMYHTIYFEIIKNVNFALLIPTFLGAGAGLLFGAKLIKFLLKHYEQQTYMGITGLLVGSAFQLFKNSFTGFDLGLIFSLIVMAVLAVLIYKFSEKEIKGE